MRRALCLLVVAWISSAADLRLADAAKQGDRKAVRALLDQHADINAPQVDGTTALHWSVRDDDVEMSRLLLKAGANPNAANRYGMTVLSQACTNGNGEIVQMLLDAGADPNAALPG